MTKLNKRQRLLIAGLGLAAGVWAIDSLTGGGQPQQARAAQKPTGEAAVTVQWCDVSQTVARLTDATYRSIAPDLLRVERDLFAPSAVMERVYAPAPSVPVAKQPVEQDPAVVDFVGQHTLDGVLTGRRPVAVINGRPLALGAELDGHRLVEVARARVSLERVSDGEVVELELASPNSPR